MSTESSAELPDVGQYCRLQQEIEAALQAGNTGEALDLYLRQDSEPVRKPSLEWALVSSILKNGLELPQEHAWDWPTARLEQPSGAALRFAVAQLAEDGPLPRLPPGLDSLPTLAGRYQEILARIWLAKPDCPALADPTTRQQFAGWLATHPPAIGDCLLTVASSTDGLNPLSSHLAQLWLDQGLLHPEAPRQIVRAASIPTLADVARCALHSGLGVFFEDNQALVHLVEAALCLGDQAAALAITETLLDRELGEEIRRWTLAVRLVALAEALKRNDLAVEYRQRWIPTGWAHPWPERLLYVLQEIGEDALERHLLTTMQVNDQTPRWVLLTREILDVAEPSRPQLAAWQSVYEENPQDERLLVGITRVILRCPRPVRKPWIERLGLQQRWQQLAAYDAYRDLAGAFLVLLLSEEEDRIVEFESRLRAAPLDSLPVRWAGRAYVAALRKTKQWSRLGELEAGTTGIFQACPFAERELVRVMARLSALPEDAVEERRWCEGWERLISLPLSCDAVIEMLDHFVNLCQSLERRGGLRHDRALFDDVTFQVMRRGKAEGEAILAGYDTHATEIQNLRDRLRRAGPEATLRLLQELIVTSP